MKKLKKLLLTIILVALLITNISVVFAGAGYNNSNIDSYVGQKIIDLNYYHSSKGYYPYKKRLDSSGNMQCVGYAYARLEEKLGLSPDFSSGAGAKDIPNNAPNGQTRTAIDGTVYTIEVYKNDGGSHVTANSWVSFGPGNSSYGHVIYVEEVIGDTIYYTESGTSMWKNGTAGNLKKKSKYNFINKCSSGGTYVGTIVFRSGNGNTKPGTCSHLYTDPNTELCNKCGEKYWRVEKSESKKYIVNVKSINLRTVPYSKIGGSNGVSYAGEVVTSSMNVINMYGNKWVKITNSKGQTGYTYLGNLKEYSEPQTSSLNIDLTKYPTSLKQGSNFGLRGTVSSNYNVKQIKGYILNGNTTVQSTVDNLNKKSVDVSGINLNNNLIFNYLGAGNYTLVVEATDSSGKTVTIKKYFEVYANQTKTASSLSINLVRYPVTLKQGTSFGLRGSVDSNYTIAKVRGYVKNSTGSVVLSSTDTPNSTSMNIQYADLNNSLVFNKLSAGNYTMIVEATDTSGRVVTATKNFTVQGNTAPTTTSTNTRTGIVNIPSSWTDLSIRTGPSTNYQIVGGMPHGARCTVYPDKASNGWYYVEYNGVQGYAAGNRINLQ